jgi:hypothetical protein
MQVFGPKEFIYRYDGDPDREEIVFDVGGSLPIPAPDQIIMRKGRDWKVSYAHVENPTTHMPIVSVFLTEKVAASPPPHYSMFEAAD